MIDLDAEHGVLSFMMWHPGKVQSLSGDEFSDPRNKSIYLFLRSGVNYEELLVNATREEQYRLQDIYTMPALSHQGMLDAIADLKRLHRLRPLVARIERWQERVEFLSVDAAYQELAKAIRG